MIGKARLKQSRFTFYILRFTLSATAVLLFYFILRTVSLAETWAVLRRLGWWQLALLAVANGVVLLLLNGRWWLILRGQDHPIAYLTLTRYRLASASLSYITPGPQFGGEPLQVLLIERNHGIPRATAVATIALDKTLELIVNFGFLLGSVALFWQTQMLGEMVGWKTAVFPLLLLAFPITFLISLWQDWQILTHLTQRLTQLFSTTKWATHIHKLHHSLSLSEEQLTHFCRQQPHTLILAFLVSLVAWAALMAEFWLMLTLLGIQTTFWQMILILTAARVATLLPLPGGLGTLEASQIIAFTAFGFEPASALSFSLLIRARDVLLASLGIWVAKTAIATVPPS